MHLRTHISCTDEICRHEDAKAQRYTKQCFVSLRVFAAFVAVFKERMEAESMNKHKTLFLTQRGLQHQQWAMEGAPPELELIMRRGASREELLALLADAEFLITERTGIIDAGMIAAAPKLRLIQRLGRQSLGHRP